jgi:GAF domain-containing protein
MAEEIIVTKDATRAGLYDELLPQIRVLIEGETDLIANLANICAALNQVFGFLWIGFYLRKGNELVLGPFQGPVACTRIQFGEGVCGHVFRQAKTEIVPNVDEFPGHITCSSASRSEIVVPIIGNDGSVIGVLDVDSERLNDFGEVDKAGLERIVNEISL